MARARSLLPEPVGPATATRGSLRTSSGRGTGSSVWLLFDTDLERPRYTIKRCFDPSGGLSSGRKKDNFMIRIAKALLCAAPLGSMLLAQPPQAPAPRTAPGKETDKPGAYYNFAMGRLYAQLAASEGNKNDYVTKSIQHYKEALRLDPTANIAFEELTDLYIQTNRLADAVSQAEEVLKQNPDNLDARRLLGRIYTRMISENQPGRVDERYVRRAVEQYEIITQKDPKDADSWVMLGRLYQVSNKSPEAEKAFNTALSVDADNEEALTGLAKLYTDLGDTTRAAEKLKILASKAPNER